MKRQFKTLASVAAISAVLSACGGSGDSAPSITKSDRFMVTTNSNSGGYISSDVMVDENNVVQLRITADRGYLLDSITGCNGDLDGEFYTTAKITSPCTVSANFKPVTFSIATQVLGDGEVTSDKTLWQVGEAAVFTLNAGPNHILTSITGDCEGVLENTADDGLSTNESTIYTVPAIISDCEIIASFNPVSKLFTNDNLTNSVEMVIIEGDYSISPTSKGVMVPEQSADIASLENFAFPYGVLDFELSGSVGEIALINLEYSEPLPENFKYMKYAKTTADAAPSWFEYANFTLSADRRTLTLSLTDGELGDDDWLSNGIIKDHSGPAIPAEFTVTASAADGGKITPTSQAATAGQALSFSVKASQGYETASVDGCSGELKADKYQITQVENDCSITASFNLIEYSVTASANKGGEVDQVSQVAHYGDKVSVQLTPDNGYQLDLVTGCNGSLTGNNYTSTNITENCNIKANFSEISYQITTVNATGGSVSPESSQVKINSSTSFSISANKGYKVGSVSGCGGVLSGSSYSVSNISADCTITPTFTAVQLPVQATEYNITTSSTEGGSISPAYQTLEAGSSASFTLSSEAGYLIESASGCGGGLEGSVYTVENIGRNCNVSVVYKLNNVSVPEKNAESLVKVEVANLELDLQANLTVVSPTETISLNSNTSEIKIKKELGVERVPVVLTGEKNVPLLIGMVGAAQENKINIESTAIVFVLRQSTFWGIEIKNHIELEKRIKKHDRFSELVTIIIEKLKIEDVCPLAPECNFYAESIAQQIAAETLFTDLVVTKVGE